MENNQEFKSKKKPTLEAFKYFLGIKYFLAFGFIFSLLLTTFLFLDINDFQGQGSVFENFDNKKYFVVTFFFLSNLLFFLYFFLLINFIKKENLNFSKIKSLFLFILFSTLIVFILESFTLFYFWKPLELDPKGGVVKLIIFSFMPINIVCMFLGISASTKLFFNWQASFAK